MGVDHHWCSALQRQQADLQHPGTRSTDGGVCSVAGYNLVGQSMSTTGSWALLAAFAPLGECTAATTAVCLGVGKHAGMSQQACSAEKTLAAHKELPTGKLVQQFGHAGLNTGLLHVYK